MLLQKEPRGSVIERLETLDLLCLGTVYFQQPMLKRNPQMKVTPKEVPPRLLPLQIAWDKILLALGLGEKGDKFLDQTEKEVSDLVHSRGSFGSNSFRNQLAAVDAEYEFLAIYMGLPESERKAIGHDFEGMFKSCIFEGVDCLDGR